jgi:hypothetical protein
MNLRRLARREQPHLGALDRAPGRRRAGEQIALELSDGLAVEDPVGHRILMGIADVAGYPLLGVGGCDDEHMEQGENDGES